MRDPDQINEALLADFDPKLIEDKQGKRYIGHEHIRMRVIDATGNQFDWHVTEHQIRDQDGVIRARKSGTVPPVMIVSGTLTIPGLGTRHGIGVQVLEENAGEDTYKAAESDAFKRAAMAFGVGLRQLYMGESAPVSRATTKSVQQRTPANVREELTDAEFDEEVRKALALKDGRRFAELADEAGKYTSRWLVLIRNCETEQSLDWLERRCQQMGMMTPLIEAEIPKRREQIVAEAGARAF